MVRYLIKIALVSINKGTVTNMYRFNTFVVLTIFLMLMGSAALAQPQRSSPVVVTKVVEMELRKPLSLVGSADPLKRSLIASEVDGIVVNRIVDEGDYVKRGDTLLEFDKTKRKIELRNANASKREAQARYVQARNNHKRFQKLFDEGIASVQQITDTQAERDAWRAKVAQYEASIDELNYELDRSNIKAPYDGFIIKEHTEVGQWVNIGDPVLEITDLSKIKIAVDVPERFVNKIKKNDIAEIRFDALSGQTFRGSVFSIVPQADEAARNFVVKFVLPNTDNLFIGGMVARVSMRIGKKTVTKLIPKDAIVDFKGAKMAYVVQDGIANPVPVIVGQAYNDLVAITGDLKKGQLVVIRGNERLRPGQAVSITNKDMIPDKS